LDIAGERRRLDLVQNFQRFRLNMDRLFSALARQSTLAMILCRSYSDR
jgi:hypothetical protein